MSFESFPSQPERNAEANVMRGFSVEQRRATEATGLRKIGLRCMFALSLMVAVGATPNRAEIMHRLLGMSTTSSQDLERTLAAITIGKPSRRAGEASAKILQELKGNRNAKKIGTPDTHRERSEDL